MNAKMLIEQLKNRVDIRDKVTRWETIPAQPAQYADFPEGLHPDLQKVLRQRGLERLYTHQAAAVKACLEGKHVVTVTPTASGKTLCYNLPVLHRILEEPEARALYIFPTKALAHDQMKELNTMVEALDRGIKGYTYDGDTPPAARQMIRRAGHLVVTNPDMLHQAVLPHHTKWVKLFENLRYIVIDELHAYRGVFGSHFANVLRRLKRICRHYGSDPQFILSSATIANPLEFAEKLVGAPVCLVDNNGAPSDEKHFVFFNPPVVNPALGIRRSSVLEARTLAEELIRNDVQTIVFARSRVRVEVLLTYLQKTLPDQVRGYRGGYLPTQRRKIEEGLRKGQIRGVVSTNALELGIDIGELEACVICGYPGTIASTWQQAGRAGRRQGASVTFLVASSNPLDQYVIEHPEYFLQRTPEHALIQPDNLVILVNHIKCAAYELPFTAGEEFGVATTEEVLDFLVEERILHRSGGRWYWMDQSFPAKEISLRSAAQENFVIIDITETGHHRVLGEVDRFSAPTLIHEEAIYLHEGVQYQVEKLDYEEKKAFVRKVDVDYYTDANLAVQLRVLEVERTEVDGPHREKVMGEVTVNALATLFKKIKFGTHENIGSGPIHLPEEEMHTTAYWLTIGEEIAARFGREDLQSGLVGLSNVLSHLAPLYLMCDPRDLGVVTQVKATHSGKPTIFLYDKYPGGVGLSEKLFELHRELLHTSREHILRCPCEEGCPSCTGPAVETGSRGKGLTLTLLDSLLEERES
ncbi:DEAD/DEAH box helicase [Kroppenstedtia eburnea]|uniref:DEAD/DEAH box helicase domain-containing protein n=1 Tax=Kroppenstedtia eburnea TaxID=714067 RepID=A0A1N7IKS2_9BACL|nr:DEAD/DEAH box helicase [Kroppenstedtia eburnea]QKI81911.1 DEAD/DEAH box helicase [Kroppenstedtia eburnea]SIS37677.1 DEAD/DEAH box helicase domain-containing protein [Kroppenstedtia eburnea]